MSAAIVPAEARPLALAGLAVAAQRYDLSPMTIRRHIAAGSLTGYRLGPRLLKVDLLEADEFFLRPVPTAGGARS